MADSSTTHRSTSLKRGFTEGSVGRHLMRLGSFMAFGSVTLNIAQLAEAVYLGIVGTEALAAMGFAFPITITLFAFAGGIGTGASSVIARAIGGGNRDRAARLVTHAQLLTLLLGIFLGCIGMVFADEIVDGLGCRRNSPADDGGIPPGLHAGVPLLYAGHGGLDSASCYRQCGKSGHSHGGGIRASDCVRTGSDFRMVWVSGHGYCGGRMGVCGVADAQCLDLLGTARSSPYAELVFRSAFSVLEGHSACRWASHRQWSDHAGVHADHHASAGATWSRSGGRLQRCLPCGNHGTHDPLVCIVFRGAVSSVRIGEQADYDRVKRALLVVQSILSRLGRLHFCGHDALRQDDRRCHRR